MDNDRYLKAFNPDEIVITPYRARGIYKLVNNILVKTNADDPDFNKMRLRERRAEGVFEINLPDIEFSISLPVENDVIPNKYIKIAKNILAKLDDLDAIARENWSAGYDECLTYIEISEQQVHFHYVAGTENTEWGAYFTIGADEQLAFESWG